jgi:hypothetical protein
VNEFEVQVPSTGDVDLKEPWCVLSGEFLSGNL